MRSIMSAPTQCSKQVFVFPPKTIQAQQSGSNISFKQNKCWKFHHFSFFTLPAISDPSLLAAAFSAPLRVLAIPPNADGVERLARFRYHGVWPAGTVHISRGPSNPEQSTNFCFIDVARRNVDKIPIYLNPPLLIFCFLCALSVLRVGF